MSRSCGAGRRRKACSRAASAAILNEGLTPSGAPAISHNGYFVLVDANLVIRGVYDSSDIKKLDELMHHARYLARMSRSYKFGGG